MSQNRVAIGVTWVVLLGGPELLLIGCGPADQVGSVDVQQVSGNAAAPKVLSDAERVETWRKSMVDTPLPKEGCFKAHIPDANWTEVPCLAGTARKTPFLPSPSLGANALTVGGTNTADFSAQVTTGVISQSTGYFPSISGILGAILAGVPYSLQLNTNGFYNPPACSGAKDPTQCQGFQQFAYSAEGPQGGLVFMQYWLVNYGRTTCPNSTWQSAVGYQGELNCWKNSAGLALADYYDLDYLDHLTLNAKVSGGWDTVTLTDTGQGAAWATTGTDVVLGLASHWVTSEFNVFGPGNGSQINLGNATLEVKIAVSNGKLTAPTCPNYSGTAETNNLSLVPNSCCPKAGAFFGTVVPSITFTESYTTSTPPLGCN